MTMAGATPVASAISVSDPGVGAVSARTGTVSRGISIQSVYTSPLAAAFQLTCHRADQTDYQPIFYCRRAADDQICSRVNACTVLAATGQTWTPEEILGSCRNFIGLRNVILEILQTVIYPSYVPPSTGFGPAKADRGE